MKKINLIIFFWLLLLLCMLFFDILTHDRGFVQNTMEICMIGTLMLGSIYFYEMSKGDKL